MTEEQGGDEVAAVAALDDPVRRRLYDYVVERGRPVGRDEAAGAVGVKRPLAAYHLDRLARAGVLDVHYERPPGRAGPGAGRPAKLYRRAVREVSVTLPPRRYELAAELLAAAVEDSPARTRAALARHAESKGQALADAVARRREADGGPDAGRAALVTLLALLQERGYEPYDDAGTIRLRNCPFSALADRHRSLVCGMNLALLTPLSTGAGVGPLTAVLEPRDGQCCVALHRARSPGD